jgi:excisionase family DNA binding protein
MSDLLKTKEVAEQLRVDATTVRRWIRQGILEGVLLPHRGKREIYRVKQETIDHLPGFTDQVTL